MKFRVEVAVEDDAGQITKRAVVMEKLYDFEKAVSVGLGMTLADGKDLLQAVQGTYIEAQVESIFGMVQKVRIFVNSRRAEPSPVICDLG